MQQDYDDCVRQSQEDGFWQEPEKAVALLKQKEALERQLDQYQSLEKSHQSVLDLHQWSRQEQDSDILKEVQDQIHQLWKQTQKIHLECLFSDPDDTKDCFLSVQAGSGGTEAQDWAQMLLRMYTRWADAKGYKVEWLEESPGEEAGYKSATLKIQGNLAYGWLKGETGVHRLVRISPFDSNARRHTSFASITITPQVEENLKIEILDKDVKIDTYRASGAGGQHVNKTDSAVRITHIPTGCIVQCQQDRSQHRNRAMAMDMLRAKLYANEKKKKQDLEASQRDEEQGITWGQQIRSYVLQPYQMVKDLRTQTEVGNALGVLEGNIDPFLEAYLKTPHNG